VAGVSEAMIDATTGVLVPPCDIGVLRDALRRLVNDAGLRAEMGLAARRHILGEHRLETQAQRNAELLTAMCGPR
jgi:glycosyltransferase involved in cell wall biosynthesis